MHPKIESFLNGLEKQAANGKSKEPTLKCLDEDITPNINYASTEIAIGSWGDLTYRIYIDHVRDVVPALRTLREEFGKPSVINVELDKALFNYQFEHYLTEDETDTPNKITVWFYLTDSSTCRLVEVDRHFEERETVNYKMVCGDTKAARMLSSNELSAITLDEEGDINNVPN